MRASGNGIRRYCEVVAVLRAGPISVGDICVATGAKDNTVRRYLRVMASVRLVEPVGHGPSPRGVRPLLWRWVQ